MEPRFPRALKILHKLLLDAFAELQLPIRFALIGGLAMSAWGVVRATEDIDLLADNTPSPLSKLTLRDSVKKFLEDRGCKVEWRVGDVDDPIPLLLRITLPRAAHNLTADVLWAHKRWQREALGRIIKLRVSRMEVYVLHPEDLILMKLEAGGPRDLLDIEEMLFKAPSELNLRRLKRKAAQLRLGTELSKCLRQI